jgi:hypothetical protein
VALIQPPDPKQTVEIELPPCMHLKDTQTKKQRILDGPFAQVNWLVGVDRDFVGKALVKARLSGGKEAKATLSVGPRDSKLILITDRPATGRRGFWVAAYVLDPKPGQKLKLELGALEGVRRHPDSPEEQEVPALAGPKETHSRVLWWVDAEAGAEGKAELTVTLQPGGAQERAAVNLERGSIIK